MSARDATPPLPPLPMTQQPEDEPPMPPLGSASDGAADADMPPLGSDVDVAAMPPLGSDVNATAVMPPLGADVAATSTSMPPLGAGAVAMPPPRDVAVGLVPGDLLSQQQQMLQPQAYAPQPYFMMQPYYSQLPQPQTYAAPPTVVIGSSVIPGYGINAGMAPQLLQPAPQIPSNVVWGSKVVTGSGLDSIDKLESIRYIPQKLSPEEILAQHRRMDAIMAERQASLQAAIQAKKCQLNPELLKKQQEETATNFWKQQALLQSSSDSTSDLSAFNQKSTATKPPVKPLAKIEENYDSSDDEVAMEREKPLLDDSSDYETLEERRQRSLGSSKRKRRENDRPKRKKAAAAVAAAAAMDAADSSDSDFSSEYETLEDMRKRSRKRRDEKNRADKKKKKKKKKVAAAVARKQKETTTSYVESENMVKLLSLPTATLMQRINEACADEDVEWGREHTQLSAAIALHAVEAAARSKELRDISSECGGSVARGDVLAWIKSSNEFEVWAALVLTRKGPESFDGKISKAMKDMGYSKTGTPGRPRWILPEGFELDDEGEKIVSLDTSYNVVAGHGAPMTEQRQQETGDKMRNSALSSVEPFVKPSVIDAQPAIRSATYNIPPSSSNVALGAGLDTLGALGGPPRIGPPVMSPEEIILAQHRKDDAILAEKEAAIRARKELLLAKAKERAQAQAQAQAQTEYSKHTSSAPAAAPPPQQPHNLDDTFDSSDDEMAMKREKPLMALEEKKQDPGTNAGRATNEAEEEKQNRIIKRRERDRQRRKQRRAEEDAAKEARAAAAAAENEAMPSTLSGRRIRRSRDPGALPSGVSELSKRPTAVPNPDLPIISSKKRRMSSDA